MTQQENSARCKEIFALLSEYLNLELPADGCTAIEAHLAGCPPCSEFAGTLRSTVALCREYEPRSMPAPISSEARERLREACATMLERRS